MSKRRLRTHSLVRRVGMKTCVGVMSGSSMIYSPILM